MYLEHFGLDVRPFSKTPDPKFLYPSRQHEEALARLDPRQCKVVELRYFGGLSVRETAAVLEISPATVKREWVTAKAWLFRRLRD